MDFFLFMLICSFIIGTGFILYSVVNFHGQSAAEAEGASYTKIEDKIEAFGTSLSEADHTLVELDDKSRAVMQELDTKYQELLFLYNMIDQKKTETTASAAGSAATAARRLDVAVGDDKRRRQYKNTRLLKILELQNAGLSVSEIAKKMNMGKGEVSLILSLGKDGNQNA